jgi:cyclohexanecarboxylate-CoA ligase
VAVDRWLPELAAKTAAVDARRRYTYGELAEASRRVAAGLRQAGVRAGDVVACQLPNWNEFALVAVAVSRLGAIITPIPPPFRETELRFILGITEARALVLPGVFRNFDHASMIGELRRAAPALEAIFVCRGEAAGPARPFEALLEPEPIAEAPLVDVDAVAEVIFTSGTTGEPKGVMHSARTQFAVLAPIVPRLGFSPADVTLMPSTFGHQTGFLYGLCLTFQVGGTGVWMDMWQPEAAASLIERERVTFTMGATPFLKDLSELPTLGQRDFHSLRLFICAGAPIPRELARDARHRLGCAISAGWGMSENGLVTINALDDPEEKITGTDGAPIDGTELRVVGPEGAPLPAGIEGELQSRGPSSFVGYWKRPAETRRSWTADGWFMTGDRGRLDADGYLTITGRSKDIIIRGGENISPAEIENLLYAHPKVQAVAAVGVPDPRLQERVCVCVVPRAGQSIELSELTGFLAEKRLARFKLPERLLVLDALPTTPSGKVQKFKLRAQLAGEG